MNVSKLALALLASSLLAHLACGADRLSKAIEQGLVTMESLPTLTAEDVPKKWRTTTRDESNARYVRKAYLRGDRKVLVVAWNREWIDAKAHMFTATVHDGRKRLCTIFKFADGTLSVMPQPKNARTYDLSTSIKPDGRTTVTLMNDDGYLEVVELRGRDTCLLDDLAYAREALTLGRVVQPLEEAAEAPPGRTPPPRK